MPFPMKIQPIDIDCQSTTVPVRAEPVKPIFKSRLKRLFDRQFRISSVEKPSVGGEATSQYGNNKVDSGGTKQFELCLFG